MDYQKLAELLYPNVKYDIDYYLNKFPQRQLPNGALVTRVAPSPTGYLHIGTLYQALLDYTLAKQSGGVFYIRLEDTDQKREIKDAGQVAISVLNKFGIFNDEGYMGDKDEIGDYGPYVQSKRLEIYHTFAKHLVSIGRAFPCFCDKTNSKEDVLEKREKSLEESCDIEDKDECRNLSLTQIKQNLAENKKWCLRLLSIGNQDILFDNVDLIKGERQLRQNTKDIVLIKSDGIPVYAFAHLVDDTLMGTNCLLRGEEWFQSVNSHIELFEAFGFKLPNYAHTPVICKLDNGNKRKLSKRKDEEADSRRFLELGFPTNAVLEYLMNLANGSFEDWRKDNQTLPLQDYKFSLEKMSSNNPMFDMNKLIDISKTIISQMSNLDIYDKTLNWAKIYDKEFFNYLNINKNYFINVIGIDRDGEKPRKDLYMWSMIKQYYDYMFFDNERINYNFEKNDKINNEYICKILNKYAYLYDENMSKDEWFSQIKSFGGDNNFCVDNKEYKLNPNKYYGNIGMLCNIIRVALTGKNNTPDLYFICKYLGKNIIKNRIEYVCNCILNK